MFDHTGDRHPSRQIRVSQDVFDPGHVFTPNWFLKVDLYEVTVIQ